MCVKCAKRVIYQSVHTGPGKEDYYPRMTGSEFFDETSATAALGA
jgi:hypothetical protein